ncbi:MAG: FAD-dependent oxidoreductase, partial [Flavobacteriales bacterium]|nr:FAD-dependent oxidoreductase [Flavobacteriales bacterium]
MHQQFDVAIIGGGIVGAATYYKIQKRNPELKIVLFEKETDLAAHQTGHNSGVIHSGLYYKPGSLKALNCVKGRKELVAFCQEHKVAHDVCGKVVVATDEKELPFMEKIFKTGQENGIEGIEKIDADSVKEIEPFVES